jgi:hypothetical protein
MHRAALPAIALLGAAGIAAAEPWSTTLESGAEADSNVGLIETGLGEVRPRIAAPAGRAGGRIENRGTLLDGGYVVGLSGLVRMVANASAKDESVMLYTADTRWLRSIGARPIAAGIHLTAADSFGMLGVRGARTFRNLGGDALLVIGRDDERRLTLGIGGRDFSYKPDHAFNWRGAVASARLETLLWQTADKTESLELATAFNFEARRYGSDAVTSCTPDQAPSDVCTMNAMVPRDDRYQRAGADLRWTGSVIATGGYQLTVIDSNSYSQSLIRHRLVAAVTIEVFRKLLGTVTGALELDSYPDGIPIANALQHEFTNLDDENRSSLQLLLSRELTSAWSLELRGAIWRDFANAGMSYRRELVYAGAIYSR